MTAKNIIMVVDDSTESRMILEALLKDLYEIIQADSG